MTAQPIVSAEAKYSIKEAASILGIHRNTLRRYTQCGLIKCGFRRTNGRPFYTGRAILQLWNAQI